MKGGLIVLFIVLSCLLVNAATERITLRMGENIIMQDKNITLVTTSEDAIVVCVNNEKKIVTGSSTVNGVSVIIEEANRNSAELRLQYECKTDCYCKEDCNNNQCFYYGSECIQDTECDDNNIDTIDKCTNGKCVYEEKQTPETGGRNETSSRVECTTNTECNDNNNCTKDSCVNGICYNEKTCEESNNNFSIPITIGTLLIVSIIILGIIYYRTKPKKKTKH